jgi:hypothetical protein
MQQSLTIPARFRGPPLSGNGGYVAGAVAECFRGSSADMTDAALEVTLRAPIPLDKSMRLLVNELVDGHASGGVQLILGETLIAEAQRTELELEIPRPPSYADALAARAASPSLAENLNPHLGNGTGFHPICFCCGADVAPDAGLHVYAAPVAGFDGVTAAWRPHASFADAQGYLPEPVVWAGLDCPGQFAWLNAGIRTGMLGRITGRMLKRVAADQDLRVTGWCIDVERKKHFAGTALFDESGDLCAYTRQVWIGRWD